MTDDEFAALLQLGYERRGVEFKGPGKRTDKQLLAQVARAALGMSNRRDGGVVILGVQQDGARLTPVGLGPTDLATWTYDDVAVSLAAYADPTVSFELEIREYRGSSYVILSVYEFEEIPVLCKRDYKDVLRKGACYVRSLHKPETSEVPSQTEMRELVDLATTKALRSFLSRAQSADILPLQDQGAHTERFNQQLGDLR